MHLTFVDKTDMPCTPERADMFEIFVISDIYLPDISDISFIPNLPNIEDIPYT